MAELFYHSAIQEHLRSLSELDQSVGPIELICGWFDDLYFPAEQSCPFGYPQDTWDRGQREWIACFSSTELAALAAFHDVFAQYVDSLTQDWDHWRQDSNWLAIQDAAKVALDRFRSAA